MPQEPNSFVGRERELDELRKLLGVTRALTLCGAGGIGKTRLALRVLAAVADEYPDGAWFVELGDLRQPDLVVSRMASAIGVGEEPGRPLLETLADALRSRTLLLVLDNCEHLIDACAAVGQRLLASSPGLRLMTTSRQPLRVAAETVWQVPPLSVAPAGEHELLRADAAAGAGQPRGRGAGAGKGDGGGGVERPGAAAEPDEEARRVGGGAGAARTGGTGRRGASSRRASPRGASGGRKRDARDREGGDASAAASVQARSAGTRTGERGADGARAAGTVAETTRAEG